MTEHAKESRILIVDDTPQNIQVLGTILRDEGYKLHVARNGKQALETAGKALPDLILLDVMMPEMDGFEACERLKADASTRDIPVIFLTAKTEAEDIARGFGLGAVDYVTKPFFSAELLARVRTHLDLRALRLHLEQVVDERTRELRQTVKKLEARDALLEQMHYLHEPQETLELAIRAALELSSCDAGALYLVDPAGEMTVAAVVGSGDGPDAWAGSDGAMGSAQTLIAASLAEAATSEGPALMEVSRHAKESLGIHSAAVLPIRREEEVVALLEVGRTEAGTRLETVDLVELEGFLPYVAMAIVDYRLQRERPEWGDDVDELLKEASDWSE